MFLPDTQLERCDSCILLLFRVSISMSVTNVCRHVDSETSDFEMIDTSEDEWVPAKGNSDVDEEGVIPNKTKKEKKKRGESR